ncbi:MAG: hypothetical protein R3204_14595 [Oceanospirillum sp.]|nr:hypothetical protein [Oceanospirillum sp.]
MNQATNRLEATALSAAAPSVSSSEESIPSPDGHSNLIDTDYVIGQDNITSGFFGLEVDLHSKVFLWS